MKITKEQLKEIISEELNEMNIPDQGAAAGKYHSAKDMFYTQLRRILEEFVTESGGKFDKAMALRIQRGVARVLGDRK